MRVHGFFIVQGVLKIRCKREVNMAAMKSKHPAAFASAGKRLRRFMQDENEYGLLPNGSEKLK
jgi:hypothetical protein